MRQLWMRAGLCALLAMPLALSACSGDKAKDGKDGSGAAPTTTIDGLVPVETMYNKAADLMDKENYVAAAKAFEDVDRQYPYSQWATKAEMMAAYAYYKNMNYDDAISSLDRYVELHPGNKDVDYALYLKALCYYEQISDVARDQGMTEDALKAFNTLIRRYPDSKYTRDAQFKRDLTLDHLAGKEMDIGRYYLNRGDLNAAMNRFLVVVKNYQTTTHVPEALFRLVEAYMTLGMRDQATKVAAVLGYNYPGSKWYKDAYQLMDDKQRKKLIENQSFVDKTIDTLFKPD